MATMTTHEPYRPQEYARQNFTHDQEFAPRSPLQYSGQMTTYQPPTAPLIATGPSPQPPVYQQNPAAFAPVHNAARPRRSRAADRDRYEYSDEEENDSEYESEPEQKTATTGGPMVGAASGALLGANIGGGKGFRTAGTLGGMVAGALAGGKMERSFKDRRQEKLESKWEPLHSARRAQEEYNDEYTKVASLAPGYGSSLLPSDTSHGGSVNRNSRASSTS